jgi:hypothetical protein
MVIFFCELQTFQLIKIEDLKGYISKCFHHIIIFLQNFFLIFYFIFFNILLLLLFCGRLGIFLDGEIFEYSIILHLPS